MSYIIWCAYICLLLIFPMLSLMVKAWNWNWQLAFTPLAISSYVVTLKLASIATVMNLCLGTSIAWALARYEFPTKKWIQIIIDIPMVLPTSVIGLILADLYGTQGWVGRYLTLSYGTAGMCLAMMVVSLPLVVRTMQPIIAELEKEMEEAAWCLGASPFQTFTRALWPIFTPVIASVAGLTWARCIGEFGAIMMISSNLPYKDLATSVLIASLIEQDDEASATWIALTMMLFCIVVFAIIEFKWRKL
nr:sulfate transport protein [Cyanidioschyzonaceae sp. 1]